MEKNTIRYSATGFTPPTILIHEGGTVNFKSDAFWRIFWIASEVHKDLASGRPAVSWSFTFPKFGTWKYYNKLSPQKKGRVDVITNKFFSNLKADGDLLGRCLGLTNPDDLYGCGEEFLKIVIYEKGAVAGLKALGEMRSRSEFYENNCHEYTHLVGELGYWHYQNTGEFVTDERLTTQCSHGFYHGFLRELGQNSAIKRAAFELCDETIGKELEPELRETLKGQCYLGIGQGLAVVFIADEGKGEEEAFKRAFVQCGQISRNEGDKLNCMHGFFVGVGNLYTGYQGFKLEMREDPLWLCESLEGKYKESCFVNMGHALLLFTNFDLTQALEYYTQRIGDRQALEHTVNHAAYLVSHGYLAKKGKPANYISDCRSEFLDEILQAECISGLAQSVVESSAAQFAPERALEFCQSGYLKTDDERRRCFKIALYPLIRFAENPEAAAEELCQKADPRYRSHCLGRGITPGI